MAIAQAAVYDAVNGVEPTHERYAVEPAAPDGPTQLKGSKYVAEFKLTKRIGKIDSTFRTDEQTTIAFFWAEGAGTVTPPGH